MARDPAENSWGHSRGREDTTSAESGSTLVCDTTGRGRDYLWPPPGAVAFAARRRLQAVGAERQSPAHQQRRDPDQRVEVGERGGGEDRASRHPDERVDGIPT